MELMDFVVRVISSGERNAILLVDRKTHNK